MRVVVSCDAIAGLAAREASEVVARAFHDAGAQVAVSVLGASGAALREALAPLPDVGLLVPASVGDLRRQLDACAAGRYVVDLTGLEVGDLGAGLLEPIGEDPGAALAAAREAWRGLELMAVVAEDEVSRPLTGLSGLASTAGRASGMDIRAVLAADAQAEAWLGRIGLPDHPGAGAAGGLGLLLAACGATIQDGLSATAALLDLAQTMRQADVVVTGSNLLDFHAVGGPLVKRVAAMGEEALRPVVAVAGRNFVPARELRLSGIETVAALVPASSTAEPSREDLVRVARQVAATWTW